MKKYLLIILPLILLVTNCKTSGNKENQEQKKKEFKIKLQFAGESTNNTKSIRINLKNNTDTIVSYGTMSCSWFENWVFDNDSIKFCTWDCDKNIPKTINLNPNDSISYDCEIKILSSNLKKFRIGLVILSEKDFYNFSRNEEDSYKKLIQEKRIIWSDYLYEDLKKNK